MQLKFKENLHSSAFWVSSAAFILLMLHTFGINVVDARYNQIFNAIFALLTVLGLFNAPQAITTPAKMEVTQEVPQQVIENTAPIQTENTAVPVQILATTPTVLTPIYVNEKNEPMIKA